MSSAKPPTGRRQVPITNCSKRTLFSLSNSRSNCQREKLLFYKMFQQHTLNIFFQWSWYSYMQREHVSNSVSLTNICLPTPIFPTYRKGELSICWVEVRQIIRKIWICKPINPQCLGLKLHQGCPRYSFNTMQDQISMHRRLACLPQGLPMYST